MFFNRYFYMKGLALSGAGLMVSIYYLFYKLSVQLFFLQGLSWLCLFVGPILFYYSILRVLVWKKWIDIEGNTITIADNFSHNSLPLELVKQFRIEKFGAHGDQICLDIVNKTYKIPSKGISGGTKQCRIFFKELGIQEA